MWGRFTGVSAIDFSPDGCYLLCACDEDICTNVVIWDWQKPAPLASLATKQPRFTEIRWNPYNYVPFTEGQPSTDMVYTLVSGASRQVKFWTLTMEPEKDVSKQSYPGIAYRLENSSGLFRVGAEAQDITCMCFVRETTVSGNATRSFVLTGTDKGV